MKNVIIRYGMYGGILLILLGLINWFVVAPAGYTISEVFGYASMIISLMAIPMGIKYFRDVLNNGSVTFGKCFSIGMGITTITSLVMGVYSAMFFIFAGDDFMNWYEEGLSKEEWEAVQQQMDAMPEFLLSPWFQGLVMFMTVFFIGVVISLLSSLVLKKD